MRENFVRTFLAYEFKFTISCYVVLTELTFYGFAIRNCMSTTVCVKAFVQFIFILVMILNITVATSWDSLILILVA